MENTAVFVKKKKFPILEIYGNGPIVTVKTTQHNFAVGGTINLSTSPYIGEFIIESVLSPTTFTFLPGGQLADYYTSTMTVTTIAGSTSGFADGQGTAAKFFYPSGIAIDSSGNLYVADGLNHRIRKITPTGSVTTIAGSTSGFADGQGTAAKFYSPKDIAIDSNGNLYVTDEGNHRIRKITPTGSVTTLAGSTSGFADGQGTAAKFSTPVGITIDSNGNLYVADNVNHRIRKITPTGSVTTIAGSTSGFADGQGTAAQFNSPRYITIDSTDNLYVTDYGNHRIRKITSTGSVTTLAGSTSGLADGQGTAAKFNSPSGIAIDSSGNLYVTDYYNHRIRKITSTGSVTTIAGSTSGFADGQGFAAKFSTPVDITIDSSGNLYVTDVNHRIRKIIAEPETPIDQNSEFTYTPTGTGIVSFNAPPGYIFSSSAIDGTQITNSQQTSGASQESCATICDSDYTCKGFNFSSIGDNCELFSTISASANVATSKVAFIRGVAPSTSIYTLPSQYLKSASGRDCQNMTQCNKDLNVILTNLVNSSGIRFFSTNNIPSCAYCPPRTMTLSFISRIPTYTISTEFGNRVVSSSLVNSDMLYENNGPTPQYIGGTGRWFETLNRPDGWNFTTIYQLFKFTDSTTPLFKFKFIQPAYDLPYNSTKQSMSVGEYIGMKRPSDDSYITFETYRASGSTAVYTASVFKFTPVPYVNNGFYIQAKYNNKPSGVGAPDHVPDIQYYKNDFTLTDDIPGSWYDSQDFIFIIQTCSTGYTGSSCENCAADYTWNGSACVACPTGSTIAIGVASGTARTCSCAGNYTWNGSACVACLNGGTIAGGVASGTARTCTCATGYTGSSCENCAANYTWNGLACVVCPPGNTVTAANACEVCPRIQYPFGAMSSATTGPGYYWPDAPIPINVIWSPNTNIPGTYLCAVSLCLQNDTWAVDNNTRCGGTCPRRSEMNTDGTCRQCPALPSDVRVDQTWDYDMINYPDGSGQLASYKCTLRQCPVGSYTLGYNERTCRSCDSTTASFTFNAAGFHSQYGYTPPAVGDWTNAQKEAYCTFSACKPGYQNYVAAQKACTQSCLPPPTGITATYSSGCTISACTVAPGGPIASGGLSATSGRCEATACAANYTWNGSSCTACLNGGTIVSGAASGNNRACTCNTGYRDLLCENCSLNYRWNGSACVVCATGATIAIGPASGAVRLCTCATGYTGSECENCATNYRWNGSACVACVNLHTWAHAPRSSSAQVGPASGAAQSCTCYTGYTGTSCDQCAANYIWSGSECAPCYNGGRKQSAPAVSVAGASCTCDPGYIGTQCQTCATNYAWNGSSACVACASNSRIPSGQAYGPARTCDLIENCATNYTWNGSACVACQNGSTIASGPKEGPPRSCICPINPSGTTSYSGITCTECAANYYYSNAGGGGCVACQNGGTTVAGLSTACTCPTGYAGTNCSGCATNYTPVNARCEACLNGGTATALQGLPCTCPAAYTGTKCKNCAANYRWNGSACVACPTGGTIAIGAASGPARTCIVCPTGYMLGSGTSCDTCSSNYRWNGSACVACLNGGFSWSGLASGQERLCTCSPGYVGGSCENCAADYTWNGSACVACPTGGTIAIGAASGNARSCTCATGYTGTSCENCALNYTWNGSACVACPSNSTIASGPASGPRSCICNTGYRGDTCTDCATNYWNNLGVCVACQNGGTTTLGYGTCTCLAGYTGYSCQNCAANYKWNGSACVVCPTGATIASGPASGNYRACTCPTGYMGPLCDKCVSGYTMAGRLCVRTPPPTRR